MSLLPTFIKKKELLKRFEYLCRIGNGVSVVNDNIIINGNPQH